MSTQVSARSSSPRETEFAGHLLRGSNSLDKAHDSVEKEVHAYKRISGQRARAIAGGLSDRDRQVVDLLTTVHLASGAQIRQVLWGAGESAARSARRQLAKLTHLRVLARIDRRVGGVRSGSEGFVYVLDIVGQYMTGSQTLRRRAPRAPGLAFVAHAVALTECHVRLRMLEEKEDQFELVHFEAEPSCWRHYFGPGGASKVLKPDAFVITGTVDWEDRWFLEIDRSTESPSRLRRKAEAYVEYWASGREQSDTGVFPRVLWVVPDTKRLSQLVDVFGTLSAEHWQLLQVVTDEQLTDAIRAGAGGSSSGESS